MEQHQPIETEISLNSESEHLELRSHTTRSSSVPTIAMDAPSPQPKKKRRGGSRRKTGCYACKSRHSRCDEKKPICGNCERLNLECKQSDFISQSEWSVGFETSGTALGSTDASSTGGSPYITSTEAPASTWYIFKTHIQGLELVPDDVVPPVDTLISTQTPTPTVNSATDTSTVMLTSESAFLLQSYLRTVATWMDLMDHGSTYQLLIPRLILSSPLLFHCVCAFTAKHLALVKSRRDSFWDPVAKQHYGESLRLLIAALNSSSHEHALTATILLSSYEIHGAAGLEHKRHILGAMMLIKSHQINAQSKGLDRANFWIYVRHDISVALSSEQPLLLNPDEWEVHWKEGETREDVLGNHVLWILARVINLVYGKDTATIQKRQGFLRELEEWRAGLSDTFIGIPYGDEDEDGFRKVYFPVTAAAAAAFWYHVIHILLYAEPVVLEPSYIPHIQEQASKITSIAMSEFPDSLRVFATYGLYYAAKHINGLGRKARIWHILNDVEAHLGYHTRSVGKRLHGLFIDHPVTA